MNATVLNNHSSMTGLVTTLFEKRSGSVSINSPLFRVLSDLLNLKDYLLLILIDAYHPS